MGGKWSSRPDGAVSASVRNRTYRKRQIERGKSPSLFDRGTFVAVDGEGFSEGPELRFTVDDREYATQVHRYAYLAASDGSDLYRKRISTHEALDFLLDIKINDPNAILVTFGASYDMTHMLYDLDRETLDQLLHGDGSLADRRFADVSYGDYDYRIELRLRKQLSVWRWPTGKPKHEEYLTKTGEIKYRITKCDKVTLWDVWGFFQGSFAKALDDWLPGDSDYQMVKDMKVKRGTELWSRDDMDQIRIYNKAELRCLVSIMERLREALRNVGARISRWDGAGAVAAAMLREHGVKNAMGTPPKEVRQAALHAYAGGHIEAPKLGRTDDTVHHYDVNSAYPAEAMDLPDLSAGQWVHGGDYQAMSALPDAPDGFTLARISWRFEPNMPFYPLYYRQTNGTIIYPERGHGWFWLPEIRAAQAFARAHGAIELNIHEYWTFHETTKHRPFAFIPQIYAERQRLAEAAKRSGIPDGRTIAIKLGLNAMYGKLAQQLGAKRIKNGWRLPTYFQLEWAGWITSGCRAKLMMAAIQKPAAIISFATDGIYATEPLDLPCPKEKVLGAWEYQTHEGMTIVMPGVYWTGPTKPGGRGEHFSRGFDKDKMRDAAFVHAAWRERKEFVMAESSRMITIGQSLASDTFWKMRGFFVATERRLCISGESVKRYGVALSTHKPHRRLEQTWPKDLAEDYDQSLQNLMSEPYPVVWMNEGSDMRPPINPVVDAEHAAAHA